MIVADEVLQVIDYKHGLGVLVSAERNPQMMCYASIDEVETLRKKHEGLLEQLSEAEQKVRELNRLKVHECFAVTKLTKELLDEYVESIEVHPGNEVRISWK